MSSDPILHAHRLLHCDRIQSGPCRRCNPTTFTELSFDTSACGRNRIDIPHHPRKPRVYCLIDSPPVQGFEFCILASKEITIDLARLVVLFLEISDKFRQNVDVTIAIRFHLSSLSFSWIFRRCWHWILQLILLVSLSNTIEIDLLPIARFECLAFEKLGFDFRVEKDGIRVSERMASGIVMFPELVRHVLNPLTKCVGGFLLRGPLCKLSSVWSIVSNSVSYMQKTSPNPGLIVACIFIEAFANGCRIARTASS